MDVDVQNYKGPAREFSEGSEEFDLMLQRSLVFLNYMCLWDGRGTPFKVEDFDQQGRLGLARAMAIAVEKCPNVDKD